MTKTVFSARLTTAGTTMDRAISKCREDEEYAKTVRIPERPPRSNGLKGGLRTARKVVVTIGYALVSGGVRLISPGDCAETGIAAVSSRAATAIKKAWTRVVWCCQK